MRSGICVPVMNFEHQEICHLQASQSLLPVRLSDIQADLPIIH